MLTCTEIASIRIDAALRVSVVAHRPGVGTYGSTSRRFPFAVRSPVAMGGRPERGDSSGKPPNPRAVGGFFVGLGAPALSRSRG